MSFGVVQRSRWFIQHKNACVVRECLCDLNELLLSDTEVLNKSIGGKVHIELSEQRARLRVHRRPVYKAAASRQTSEEDVLCNGKLRHQRHLLKHNRDAGVFCIAYRREALFYS